MRMVVAVSSNQKIFGLTTIVFVTVLHMMVKFSVWKTQELLTSIDAVHLGVVRFLLRQAVMALFISTRTVFSTFFIQISHHVV
jgi:hypothetical protein